MAERRPGKKGSVDGRGPGRVTMAYAGWSGRNADVSVRTMSFLHNFAFAPRLGVSDSSLLSKRGHYDQTFPKSLLILIFFDKNQIYFFKENYNKVPVSIQIHFNNLKTCLFYLSLTFCGISPIHS